MRKRIALIFLFVLLSIPSCGHATYTRHEPDDAISEAICAVVDSEDIYYQGQHTTEDDVTYYEYLIIHEELGQIEQIVESVNKVLEEELISNKINIDCWIAIPGGAGRTVNLMNYSNSTLENPDYKMLQSLCIGGEDNSIYNEPETYAKLKDIRKLEISSDIQRKAKAAGIDWYEYWPNLESVETF